MTGGVFINYRGVDVIYAPRLLYNALTPRFGRRRVFLDEESIQPGEDYVARLLEDVRYSSVLLAVIGPHWLTVTDASGEPWINDTRDWIRRELVAAYAAGVKVIPVFTQGVVAEDLEPLPPDIAQSRTTQGMELRRRNSDEDLDKIAAELTIPLSPGRTSARFHQQAPPSTS